MLYMADIAATTKSSHDHSDRSKYNSLAGRAPDEQLYLWRKEAVAIGQTATPKTETFKERLPREECMW